MRTRENDVLKKAPALQAKRLQQTKELASALTGCLNEVKRKLEQAGGIIERLVTRVWGGDDNAAYKALLEALWPNRRMSRQEFDRLLRVGRGDMLAQLVYMDGPCVQYLQQMPVSCQRELVIDRIKVDVAVIKDYTVLPTPERKTIYEMNGAECSRAFVKNGRHVRLRTFDEQKALIRKKLVASVEGEKKKHTWYTVQGDSLKLLAPRTVQRERLAELLASIVLGTPVSADTETERELFKAYRSRHPLW